MAPRTTFKKGLKSKNVVFQRQFYYIDAKTMHFIQDHVLTAMVWRDLVGDKSKQNDKLNLPIYLDFLEMPVVGGGNEVNFFKKSYTKRTQ